MFCSERKPSVVITLITAKISPRPPHYSDHWAAGVISDIKENKLPAGQTAKDLTTNRFLSLTLTHNQRADESQSFVIPNCKQSRAEQMRVLSNGLLRLHPAQSVQSPSRP